MHLRYVSHVIILVIENSDISVTFITIQSAVELVDKFLALDPAKRIQQRRLSQTLLENLAVQTQSAAQVRAVA